MAQTTEAERRHSSQENLLLDYVYRLEKHKDGRKAVQVHLSRLQSFNRREHHIRVAANSFENLVKSLQGQLKAILDGEPPHDIFVRWKPLHEQPIGWHPDINDGVRLNIRPFMAVDIPGGRKGCGILRMKPNVKWKKDRGKEPERPREDYPWFWSWDEETKDFTGGDTFTGERWNDCHYTNAFKQAARERAES